MLRKMLKDGRLLVPCRWDYVCQLCLDAFPKIFDSFAKCTRRVVAITRVSRLSDVVYGSREFSSSICTSQSAQLNNDPCSDKYFRFSETTPVVDGFHAKQTTGPNVFRKYAAVCAKNTRPRSNRGPEFDVIIENNERWALKRINKLHRRDIRYCNHLLFIYGQSGYHTKLKVMPADGSGEAKWLTILAYYRTNYTIRLYDAISKGNNMDNELCNPQFFITFTCNVNWLEIRRYMAQYPQLMTSDSVDIVCRVFEQKIHTLVAFLKKERTFGNVMGVLYTESFASATPAKLRSLFAHILLHCDVTDPSKQWTKYWKEMNHDMPEKVSQTVQILGYQLTRRRIAEDNTLYEIEVVLNNCIKSLQNFGLPPPPEGLLAQLANRLLMGERNYNQNALMQKKNESERISKKRTKNEAKTIKPDTEWKSKVNQSQRNGQQQKGQQSKTKSTMKNT
ncbi:DNA helicase [Tanacetum coccineum]